MKEIHLNDLPRYTPWIRRLLSLDPFPQVMRNIEKIASEYDEDKYLKCLKFYEANANVSIEDVKHFEIGGLLEQEICVSQAGRLFALLGQSAFRSYWDLLLNTLHDDIITSDVVVELGCGYGYNLHLLKNRHPSKRFLGGEYSANAVRLANHLFSDDPRVTVELFNFYGEDYALLERIKGRVVLFTVYSIHQLPSALGVINRIIKSGISGVVYHFEPVYELEDCTTLLGLMRQRYTEINDYNLDLLSTLEYEEVNVIMKNVDAFGLNPLHPASVISWQCN
jgi:SAM-dependent methyltransferase